MSIPLVVTRGFGNGTFNGTIKDVVLAGYSIGVVVDTTDCIFSLEGTIDDATTALTGAIDAADTALVGAILETLSVTGEITETLALTGSIDSATTALTGTIDDATTALTGTITETLALSSGDVCTI